MCLQAGRSSSNGDSRQLRLFNVSDDVVPISDDVNGKSDNSKEPSDDDDDDNEHLTI